MKWDLYDKRFNKTNIVIDETEMDNISNDLYHLTVNIWIVNANNEVLLLKKAMNYNLRYPGYWTSINGNVESGDNSIDTIYKTVYEKIGEEIKKDDIIELGKDLRTPYHYIYNTFVIYKNLDIDLLVLNNQYFSKAKWVDANELENMILNGEIEFSLISRIEKYILPLLRSKK